MSFDKLARHDRADFWSTVAFFFGGIAAIIGCFVAIFASVRGLGAAITWGLVVASIGVACVALADAIEIRSVRARRAPQTERRRKHSSLR